MFFKEKFESLSFFQKVEIVLIIIISYGGILYYLDNFFYLENKKDKEVQTIQTINISQKIQPIYQDKALKYLQNKLVDLKIENSSLVVQDQQLALEITTTYKKAFTLLSILENHIQIESFSIVSKKKLLNLQLLLDTKYMFNINETNRYYIKQSNPFYYQKENIEKEDLKLKAKFQAPTFQINAILGDEVLIDQQWYQLEESIQNNKIIKIEKDRVLFKNSTNQKTFYIKYHN